MKFTEKAIIAIASCSHEVSMMHSNFEDLHELLQVNGIIESGGLQSLYETANHSVPLKKLPELFLRFDNGLMGNANTLTLANSIMLDPGDDLVPLSRWQDKQILDALDNLQRAYSSASTEMAIINFAVSNIEMFPKLHDLIRLI